LLEISAASVTFTPVMRREIVVCVLLGCGHGRREMPPLPEGPPARLEPTSIELRTASGGAARPTSVGLAPSTLPPVAPGYVRVEAFGVDVPAPADADYLPLYDWAKLTWPGCEMSLTNGARDPGAIVVGTLRLSCGGGRGCGDACQHIRPVPGGRATEPYPTEPALIELTTYDGDNGSGSENILIWRDGTVQFDGPGCGYWRGRRGKLPAARVAELVDVLERGGFFDHEVVKVHAEGEDEHMGGWLAVRDHVLQWNGATMDELLFAARDRVYQAVGRNPCV
jgi:hypothetical protein